MARKKNPKVPNEPDRRSALKQLFMYSSDFITLQDIDDLTGPSDPGTGAYIQTLSDALQSRLLPEAQTFDLSEPCHNNWWSDSQTVRFRRFRVWTNTISLGIDDLESNNAFATLTDDVIALGDLVLTDKADAALASLDVHGETRLFLLLARILLADVGSPRPAVVTPWIEEFNAGRSRIVDEQMSKWRQKPLPLVAGIPTVFNQLEPIWSRLIDQHLEKETLLPMTLRRHL